MPVQIRCSEVRFVKELYPRLKPHDDVVERYRDALDQLPPIVVARDGILVDGYHRWQAHVREGRHEINAENLGNLSDAEIVRESIKRNASHGQQLDRKDKQRMAGQLWQTLAHLESTERMKDIAELLAVSERSVQSWTKDARKTERDQLRADVIDAWLNCVGSNRELADAFAVDDKTVGNWTAEFAQSCGDSAPESRQHFDIWQFATADKNDGQQSYFGAVPPQVMENLLWFYTDPGQIVVDLFAGSGTTVDVAKKMGRRVWASDIRGNHYSPHLPIHQHDAGTGWPEMAQAVPRLGCDDAMSFAVRLEVAKIHELRVLESLIRRGWDAEFFGQAMLSERMRSHLREIKTSVRWMPDIIAAKNITGKNIVTFTDAKAGKRYLETGNHDIETAALESAEKWIELSGQECPYYFVFDDGTVATPEDVREHGWDGPWRGNGSGTPFKLFPCTVTRSFDSVFGEKLTDVDEGGCY